MFAVKCSMDGKKWWYYAGQTRENGKSLPTYITEKEYRDLEPVQYIRNKSEFLKKQGVSSWKYITFIKEK